MGLLIFWIIIFVLASLVIALISFRHFTELAAFESSSVPRIQEKTVKQDLVTRRVLRGIQKTGERATKILTPFAQGWSFIQNMFRDRANKIADHYRHLEWKKQWQEWRGRSRGERRAHLLALLEEADEHRRAERYDHAEKKYVEILALDPKNVNAYMGLGKTYFREDRLREAEEIFSHIVARLDHANELAWAFLGRTLKAAGKWDNAVAAFRKALKFNALLAKRWMDLADSYKELGKTTEAASAYKKAAQIEPNNPKVLDQLVEISIIAGDKRLALEALNQLKAANPENQKLVEWGERIEEMKE